IVLNCAAIPHELMESEIFGHVKGAFTGAVNNRDGAATLADGGILFLDEICEMDLLLQSKLLRFIQTGTFQRVGGTKLESVDIRFVCATNKDPVKEVEGGRFREDLFYRLHVIPLELPPLRERDQDILLIANKFLLDFSAEEEKLFTCFDEQARQLLLHYAWPGNVRELQNVIRNLVVLNVGEEVTAAMLPKALQGQHNSFNSSGVEVQLVDQIAELSSPSGVIPLWLVEKKAIEAAIVFCDGNIPKAAALLDVSPSTIYRKKQTWDELVETHSK
ncbi:MAG: sigma-54-dependent Fis family transcriptional regulator, partial [Methylococcales bacterium]|nr:sigma-54-dependent Fis family transcriptional regulator [Methylococcales bacterium]